VDLRTDKLRDFFLSKIEDSERDDEARQALLESNYEGLSEVDPTKTTKWYILLLTYLMKNWKR
jgi:hypothetical protein